MILTGDTLADKIVRGGMCMRNGLVHEEEAFYDIMHAIEEESVWRQKTVRMDYAMGAWRCAKYGQYDKVKKAVSLMFGE